jgi:hypothetical protein
MIHTVRSALLNPLDRLELVILGTINAELEGSTLMTQNDVCMTIRNVRKASWPRMGLSSTL